MPRQGNEHTKCRQNIGTKSGTNRLTLREGSWYDDAMIKTNEQHALDALIALCAIDDDYTIAARTLLINNDIDYALDLHAADDITRDDLRALSRLIELLSADRELLTTLLLDHSLCPLHRIDYAICFDDDNADCAAIRTIHPAHDS